MKIVTADITGSLIVNNVDVTQVTISSSIWSGSVAGRVTNLESTASTLVAASASFALVSSSYVATSASYLVTSGSYAAASASLSRRVTNVEATASVNTQASASFAAQSASLSTRLTTDETNITTLTNASASFAAQSASLSTRLTTDETNFSNTSGSISSRVTLIEGQYATTGSNNFTGIQHITSTVNPLTFNTSASLYTDGGLLVTKDSFISGTAYFNNVVVYGTSSIQYITSSQINIGASYINLNTNLPAQRYGGMTVADSGSNAGVTGSMLWDSVNNGWIYSRESGSSYKGGALISGPRTQVQGSEQTTTACYLMAGQGGDHITSSQVYTDSNATCFYGGTSYISGSGDACFANSMTAGGVVQTANAVNGGAFRMGVDGNSNSRAWQMVSDGYGYGDWALSQATTYGGTTFTNKLVLSGGNLTIGSVASTGTGNLYANAAIFSSTVSSTGYNTTGNIIYTVDQSCFFVKGNSNGGAIRISSNSVSAGDRNVQLGHIDNGGAWSSYMTINDGGNVGIGTTSPNANLSVNACKALASVSGLTCISSGVNDIGCIFFGVGDANSALRAGAYAYQCWNGVYTDYLMKFTVTKGGTGNIDSVFLANNGWVGITAAVPAARLHVCAPAESVQLRLERGGAGCADLGADSNGFNIWYGGFPNRQVLIDSTQACFSCNVCAAGAFVSNRGAATSTYGFTHCGAGYYGRLGVPNSSYFYLETNVPGGIYIDASTRTNCLAINTAWSSGGGAYQPLQIKAGPANSGIWVESCSNDAGLFINMAGNCGLIGQSYRSTGGYGDILIQTANNVRMRIKCEGNVEVETGIVSPVFMIERNCAYTDLVTGDYLNLNDFGTQGLNAKFQQQFAPFVNTGETMTWNYARMFIRMTSNTGTFSQSLAGCIRNAGYFYGSGWYCFGCFVQVGSVMDSGRGFRWVVMPWFSYSDFIGGTDVPGLGLYNQFSDIGLRIGAVYLQYKT